MKTSKFVIRFVASMFSFGTCETSNCGICGQLNNKIYSAANASDYKINSGGKCQSNFELQKLTEV